MKVRRSKRERFGKEMVLMKKLYLITGALGHLGNTVAGMLARRGEIVRGLVLPGDKTRPLMRLPAELVEGDVCNLKSLEPFFQTEEPFEKIVIHTAGIVSIATKFDQKVYDVNVGGTKNIIAMCEKYGVKKLVYTSSVHAIAEGAPGSIIREAEQLNPDVVTGLYAKTKAEAAQLVLDAAACGLDAVVVHPSGLIGPGDYGCGHLTQLVMDFLDGRLTAGVAGGYDFADVRDVAEGILEAAQKGRCGQCYILSGSYHSIPDLLERLHKISGHKRVKTVLPLWFARLTAPLAERYYKLLRQKPLYTKYSLYTLTSNANFSCEKAKKELGYAPRNFDETLKDTVDWLRETHRVKNETYCVRTKRTALF